MNFTDFTDICLVHGHQTLSYIYLLFATKLDNIKTKLSLQLPRESSKKFLNRDVSSFKSKFLNEVYHQVSKNKASFVPFDSVLSFFFCCSGRSV